MPTPTYTGTWPDKLPNENILYGVDWSKRLGMDAIASATIVAEGTASISIGAVERTSRITKALISGGDAGDVVAVLASILTVSGKTLSERIRLKVI